MKATVKRDLPGPESSYARDVLNSLVYFIPRREIFVGHGIARCLDLFVLEYEGIQRYDFAVAVENIDC